MNKKSPLGDITPSICGAAFDEFVKHDDSVAELIHKNGIDVRDFIVLSFVCDQGELSITQVAQILGITVARAHGCIDRLAGANLVEYKAGDNRSDTDRPLVLTDTGQLVALRVHGRED
jgi:DNA-binding MarR family transcriptional regulator